MRPVLGLGELALGNVPPDAAVADEAPGFRTPAFRNGHVALAPSGAGRASSKSRKGKCVQRRAVLAPPVFVRLQVRNFPARLADLRAGPGASLSRSENSWRVKRCRASVSQ